MLEQFLHHIEENKLFSGNDKILLAVSGGIDSMVMLHLFRQAGFPFGVAHCNFQLRGEESKADEALVNSVCVNQGIAFHGKHFDTTAYARTRQVSIQMAARELRYDFFYELMEQHQYNWIATAHHLNDNLETVLFNLVRGTGMDGITGIPLKSQYIIRPLLFATREMIIGYAAFHRLSWREDSSNASDKYHRNLIRNQVIPLLKQVNPGLEQNFSLSLERLKGTAALAGHALKSFIEEAVAERGERIYINRRKLGEQVAAAVTLWEVIKNKGFTYVQCKEMVQPHQSGKVFYSPSSQLTVDREDLIVSPAEPGKETEVVIEQGSGEANRDRERMTFAVIVRDGFVIEKNNAIAQLDWQKIKFPLLWRRWKPGDKFMPLGMMEYKKLSDFLIDTKVSLPDKANITVLESAGEVIWVVEHRISERVKVTEQTEMVLCVQVHKG